jgi:hypothetical protein
LVSDGKQKGEKLRKHKNVKGIDREIKRVRARRLMLAVGELGAAALRRNEEMGSVPVKYEELAAGG